MTYVAGIPNVILTTDGANTKHDFNGWVFSGVNVGTNRVDFWMGGETNVYTAGPVYYRPKPLVVGTSFVGSVIAQVPAAKPLMYILKLRTDTVYKTAGNVSHVFVIDGGPGKVSGTLITNIYNATIQGKTSWTNNLPIPRAE
jgi:hypothetical protein